MGAVIDGIGNLISGGTWQQSGGELAAQQWNAEQAALARSFSAEEAEKARIFNAAEAQKQRDFEERLSNSAYQRAALDMKAAGLNPYLVYSQGGASTPSGVSATSPTAQTTAAGGRFNRSHGTQVLNVISTVAKAVSGLATAGYSLAMTSALALSQSRIR